ncbi:hypothetical protein QE152_g5359 [Popillia japonica]|uniref:Uncharacterized protein n=1 Tax=Popillia japonica TaxID=7064 RepID=A0AAW1MPM9_POPJA
MTILVQGRKFIINRKYRENLGKIADQKRDITMTGEDQRKITEDTIDLERVKNEERPATQKNVKLNQNVKKGAITEKNYLSALPIWILRIITNFEVIKDTMIEHGATKEIISELLFNGLFRNCDRTFIH